jgi:hypothetical protein
MNGLAKSAEVARWASRSTRFFRRHRDRTRRSSAPTPPCVGYHQGLLDVFEQGPRSSASTRWRTWRSSPSSSPPTPAQVSWLAWSDRRRHVAVLSHIARCTGHRSRRGIMIGEGRLRHEAPAASAGPWPTPCWPKGRRWPSTAATHQGPAVRRVGGGEEVAVFRAGDASKRRCGRPDRLPSTASPARRVLLELGRRQTMAGRADDGRSGRSRSTEPQPRSGACGERCST